MGANQSSCSAAVVVPRADLELLRARLQEALRLLNKADADSSGVSARRDRQRAAEMIVLCLCDRPSDPPTRRTQRTGAQS